MAGCCCGAGSPSGERGATFVGAREADASPAASSEGAALELFDALPGASDACNVLATLVPPAPPPRSPPLARHGPH